MKVPSTDGQVTRYAANGVTSTEPRIYYVNGMQTDAPTHAKSGEVLSEITERVVFGVFNSTAGTNKVGFAMDILQCLQDWAGGFAAKLAEIGVGGINSALNGAANSMRTVLSRPPADPINVAEIIRKTIPEQYRIAFIESSVARYNAATASLFNHLRRHTNKRQWIVAHSQGNLITADALWAMVFAYGENSLDLMKVYSLASPSPAWPLGIRGGRRKVYGHTNDAVTLCDPHNWSILTDKIADGKFGRTVGDWRQWGKSSTPGLDGHDINRNIALNFAKRIRSDLGLGTFAGALPQI